ncbi:MAG TPA: ABC transporter permease [Thermoanaerobaculia bacterium]|nr:ABC transporter permease [Thermoanaerobaculia bacterium]
MIGAIARFELRYHLRQPLFWILTALYFILTFFAVTSDAVQIGGAVGNVNRNAPYVIMQFLLVMTVFGVLTTTAFVANAVHRDFELGTDALFFSSPIRKWHYLAGRFLGSFLVGAMVYLGVVLAIMIGSFMPWLDKERLGPFELCSVGLEGAWPLTNRFELRVRADYGQQKRQFGGNLNQTSGSLLLRRNF